MKTVERSFVIAGLAFLIATGETLAQTRDPVVGAWELNVAKSAFSPGPAPKNEMRIYEASGSDFKLMVKGIDGDGKPTSIRTLTRSDDPSRRDTLAVLRGWFRTCKGGTGSSTSRRGDRREERR